MHVHRFMTREQMSHGTFISAQHHTYECAMSNTRQTYEEIDTERESVMAHVKYGESLVERERE